MAGGQAEYLRVPQAQYTHIKVPEDGPDERYVYLSDVLPTAWQAVEYADVPGGGTLLVLGLGPDRLDGLPDRLASRQLPCDRCRPREERLSRARDYCDDVIDLRNEDAEAIVADMTDGRGADAVIDAVGMEAHGSPIAEAAHTATGFCPPRWAVS